MPRITRSVLFACLVTAVPPGEAPASEVGSAATSFQAEYAVSYLGLPIATSAFRSTFKGNRFAMEGSLKSVGIARIFDSTTGTVEAEGAFAGRQTRPSRYSVTYATGGKDKRTSLTFRDGAVASVSNHPPLKKRGANWVPVRPVQLAGVTDPISAVLVRAGNLAEVCPRTIRVFDGELRADLKLDRPAPGTVETRAYSGEAVTCRARFIPVAGYRPDNKSIAYLRDRSSISVTFAPLGRTGVYAPISATVGTQIGPVRIDARRIEANG